MVRADFVTGLILTAIGIAALLLSLDMPRFAERNINPYTVPGLVPAALAVVIALLGAVLTVRAARSGGWRRAGLGIGFLAGDAGGRVALTLLLTLGYAAGLVGSLPFWLATFLFGAAFVIVFEWPKGLAGRVRRIGFAVLYAGLLSAAVTYVFQEIFLVRLP